MYVFIISNYQLHTTDTWIRFLPETHSEKRSFKEQLPPSSLQLLHNFFTAFFTTFFTTGKEDWTRSEPKWKSL